MASDRFTRFVEDVKGRVSIVDLAKSDGCVLKGNARSYMKGLSPLRSEKNPSFVVYPDNNSWYDFGLQQGGDVIKYVEVRDRCDFKTAVGTLAQVAGMDLYWENPDYEDKDKLKHEIEATVERQSVYQHLTEATDYYHNDGYLPVEVLDLYRKNYGMTEDTIRKYQLGYGWPGLWNYFREELEYSEETCLKTGLFAFNKKSGTYEGIFDGRLVMPYPVGGLTRYFIGRRMESSTSDDEWNKGKYKKLKTHDRDERVSPYVANDWFFNEDALKRVSQHIIITEGITDCIVFDQHGFICISPVTTSFSEASWPRLLALLERYNKNRDRKIIICNDADVAADGSRPGEKGALRTAAFLFSHGFEVYIASIPRPDGVAKVDSCEYLRDHGTEAMQKVIDAAKRYVEFLCDLIPDGLAPAELERQIQPIIEAIATCPSSIQQDTYKKIIAKRFDLAKGTVAKTVNAAKKQAKSTKAEEVPEQKSDASDTQPPTSSQRPRPQSNGIKVRGCVYKDDDIGNMSNRYLTDTTNGVEQISSFYLVPRQRIIEDNRELMQCDIHMMSGRIVRNFVFPHDAWNSRHSFVECFSSMDMAFTGSNEHVHGIRQLIGEQEVPIKETTRNVGYYESSVGRRWVWPGHCISHEGPQESPDVICKPRSTRLSDFLRYEFVNDYAKVASNVYPLLVRVNKPGVVMPLIAWFHATVFKPRLVPITRGFPILMVYGTSGSGKTSILRDVFWQLMGVANNSTVYSCTETPYAMMENLSRTNSVPTIFDEFKPGEMKPGNIKQIHALVRYVYGEQIEERGRPDLSVTQIKITTPMVIAGESMLDGDTSILERTLYVNPRKDTLDDPAFTQVFSRLRNEKLWSLAAPYIQWSLSKDVSPDQISRLRKEAIRIARRVSARELAPRVHENITIFLFGIEMFNAWCEHLSVDPYVDMPPMMDMIEEAVQTMLNELGGGSFIDVDEHGKIISVVPDSPKDVFDHFLEALSSYGHGGILEEGIHYAQVDNKLCLHLPSCYNVYLAERARRRQEDATGGLTALRRAIEEKVRRGDSYITLASKRVRMSGMPGAEARHPFVRCVEIDPKRIPSHLQYDHLRVSDNRTHGGSRKVDQPN